MYNPCYECLKESDKSYREECNNNCMYANEVKTLKAEIEKYKAKLQEYENGEKISLRLFDKDHIENTYRALMYFKDKFDI